MDFINRVFSNYVNKKMSHTEAKSVILGSFSILSSENRSDEEKVKMIKDIYNQVFHKQDQN